MNKPKPATGTPPPQIHMHSVFPSGLNGPDLNQSCVDEVFTVQMMFSLLEVLHQLPVPQGSKGCLSHRQTHWVKKKSIGVLSAQSARLPHFIVLPTASTHCFNEWFLLLYIKTHRKTAEEHLMANSLIHSY